jgi:hypothetical protein
MCEPFQDHLLRLSLPDLASVFHGLLRLDLWSAVVLSTMHMTMAALTQLDVNHTVGGEHAILL